MIKNFEIIKSSSLFNGVTEKELEGMLGCLGEKRESFNKGQFIINIGDTVDSLGLMLSGSALIIKEDFWGNRNILGKVAPSDIFAETFACLPETPVNVAVAAEEACSVLWLNINRIMTTCSSACEHHGRIIKNLLSAVAAKNLRLNDKITHMGQRTTREKALSYLSSQAQRQGSNEFLISFNRQQLADYLSVERSALSAELSRLKREGIIDFRKNYFILKN